MLVENQYVKVKWNAATRKWYEQKGYFFTKTGDEFLVRVEDLSKGNKQKVEVICDYCGETIYVAYKDYVNYKDEKYSCKKCRQTKTSQSNLLKRQDHLYNGAKKFCDKMGYTILTKKEEIMNSNSIVEYLCPKHGVCKTKVYTLLLEHGCKMCQYENNSKNNRNTIKDIIKLGEELNIKILNPEDYDGYYTINLKCACNKCGETYITSYQLLKSGKCILCPKCAKSESHGETKIRLYLKGKSIEFNQQKRFNDCRTKVPLPFDFYIPSMNTIIEYDGEGHFYKVDFKGHDGERTFNRTKENDKIKNDYCKSNNIKLIRIPYWDYDDIEKILNEKLFT